MQFYVSAKKKQERLGIMGRIVEDLKESQWGVCGEAWAKRGQRDRGKGKGTCVQGVSEGPL